MACPEMQGHWTAILFMFKIQTSLLGQWIEWFVLVHQTIDREWEAS